MKAFALLEERPHRGIRVLSEHAYEVSLTTEAVEIGGCLPALDDPLEAVLPRSSLVPTRPAGVTIGPRRNVELSAISYRAADGRVRRHARAMILYRRMADILEFLTEHYLPSRDHGFDALVDRGRRGARAEDHGADLEAWLQARGRGERSPVLEPTPPVILPEEMLDTRASRTIERAEGRFFIPYAANGPGGPWCPALTARIHRRMAGHRVPRLVYALRGPRPIDSWFAWDGERFHTATRLDRLPRPLLERLDASGQLAGVHQLDLAPARHLEPAFVLRIPAEVEVEGRGVVAAHAAPAVASTPALLAPSWAPLRLPRGLPLIDDPAEAMHLLAHTTSRVLVPPDPGQAHAPAGDGPTRLRERAAFALGLRVRDGRAFEVAA